MSIYPTLDEVSAAERCFTHRTDIQRFHRRFRVNSLRGVRGIFGDEHVAMPLSGAGRPLWGEAHLPVDRTARTIYLELLERMILDNEFMSWRRKQDAIRERLREIHGVQRFFYDAR